MNKSAFHLTFIVSSIWIVLILNMTFIYERKLNRIYDQLDYCKQQLIKEKTHQDSVIINCFKCNSRNVRYLYPDSLFIDTTNKFNFNANDKIIH